MNQEKFGQFIKDTRKKNNLTQKDLALKYNISYQAVSKWENGKNMPDISLIKQMAEDFNVSIDEMIDGKIKTKPNKYFKVVLIITLFLALILIIFLITKNNTFSFKTISTTCEEFNISGSLSYNSSKTAIYISNIKYCGGDNNIEYKKIECTLYEKSNDTNRKITSKIYEGKSKKLEDFLQTVELSIDDYSKTCKEYSENSLFLEINATDENDRITTYKIPLKLKESCTQQ